MRSFEKTEFEGCINQFSDRQLNGHKDASENKHNKVKLNPKFRMGVSRFIESLYGKTNSKK